LAERRWQAGGGGVAADRVDGTSGVDRAVGRGATQH